MSEWIRVSRDHRCTVCDKPDWCTYTEHVACCMRVPSGSRAANGGYIHRMNDGAPNSPVVTKRKPEGPALDAELYYRTLQRDTEGGYVPVLAAQLGVSVHALRLLGCAQYRSDVAAFPMFTPDRVVVGIRLRAANGRKWAVRGSRQGLFIPSSRPKKCVSDWLVICEGPTDTAAMLTAGVYAIGRPSCRGCIDYLTGVVAGHDVVIMADDDEPGRIGAWELAQAIKRRTGVLRLTFPPSCGDARDWASQASRAEIAATIDNAMDVTEWERFL